MVEQSPYENTEANAKARGEINVPKLIWYRLLIPELLWYSATEKQKGTDERREESRIVDLSDTVFQ